MMYATFNSFSAYLPYTLHTLYMYTQLPCCTTLTCQLPQHTQLISSVTSLKPPHLRNNLVNFNHFFLALCSELIYGLRVYLTKHSVTSLVCVMLRCSNLSHRAMLKELEGTPVQKLVQNYRHCRTIRIAVFQINSSCVF